jgi:molybdopterin converting factor small subunit
MKVTVLLHGELRRHSAADTPGEWSGEIAEGTTVRGLIQAIGVRDGAVSGATINGALKSLDTVIPAGARVFLFSWMSGG